MLPLGLGQPADRPLRLLVVGAHPDDIEIGAGGTMLALSSDRGGGQGLEVHYLVLTGTPDRQLEAKAAARSFLPGADLTVELRDLAEGRLPALWVEAKDVLEGVARSFKPDLILGPSPHDAHQDHRTIGQILPTVFRDSLSLAYEIPKWDGDLPQPSLYWPLSSDAAHRKTELLHKCFPSQHVRDWWDDDVFLGLARLRGMECRAPYAEAFSCTKAVIGRREEV